MSSVALEDLIALAESKLADGDVNGSQELFREVEKRTLAVRAMQVDQLPSSIPPACIPEPPPPSSSMLTSAANKRGGVSRLFGSALKQAVAERGVTQGSNMATSTSGAPPRVHSGSKRSSADPPLSINHKSAVMGDAMTMEADGKEGWGKKDEEEGGDEDDDDWEAGGWETGLGQLKRPSSGLRDKPTNASRTPPPKAPLASSSLEEGEGSDALHLLPPLDHVVEIFTGLGSSITTNHIEAFFSVIWPYCSADGLKPEPLIRWVDESHCLLVCPDAGSAQTLISIEQKQFGLRPHCESSAKARAYPQVELIAPKGERPKTTAAVARRFLSHALGIDLRDREAEKELGQQRKLAREEKLAKERARNETWDG